MNRMLALIGILTMTLGASLARAEVRDDGKFFSEDAVQKANIATQHMQRDLGKELLIETYPAIPAARAGSYDAANQDAFFKKWAYERATEAHVDGVYILINRQPTYLLAISGDKTRQRDFTASDVNELRDQMLPLMKQKKNDEALAKATAFVSERIQSHGGAGTANRGAGNSGGASTGGASTGGVNSGGASAGGANAGGADTSPRSFPPSPGDSNTSDRTGAPGSPAPMPSRGFSIGKIVILLVVVFLGIRILRRLFGGGRPAGYGGQYGQGGVGPMGMPGQGYGGQGGGGFGRGILGGLLGGMAGGWLQDRMSGHQGQNSAFGAPPPTDAGNTGSFSEPGGDTSFSGGAGGSFDSGPSDFSGGGGGGGGGGGDFGGGGGGGGDSGAGGSF